MERRAASITSRHATASWPDHLKSVAATADTWPNITEQKKALPGADEAAKEDNKISALTLEGGS